jgi:hypothetical protein
LQSLVGLPLIPDDLSGAAEQPDNAQHQRELGACEHKRLGQCKDDLHWSGLLVGDQLSCRRAYRTVISAGYRPGTGKSDFISATQSRSGRPLGALSRFKFWDGPPWATRSSLTCPTGHAYEPASLARLLAEVIQPTLTMHVW